MNFKTWREAEDSFDEFLEEVSGSIQIVGQDFYPSDILKCCDPISYRCNLNDYIDGMGIDSDDLEGEPRDY